MMLEEYKVKLDRLAAEVGRFTPTTEHAKLSLLRANFETLRKLGEDVRHKAAETDMDVAERLAYQSLVIELDDLMIQVSTLYAHTLTGWLNGPRTDSSASRWDSDQG